MDYRTILGALAIIIGFTGYVPYFRTIFNGTTKPHAFSWLVWGVLTGIASAGQFAGGAGAGAWVTAVTAVVCFAIFGLALKLGRRVFPLVDWLCLAGALLGLALWGITKDPLFAIVLITVTDMLAFIPTFRKSFLKPYTETIFTYTMSSLKFVVGLFALQTFSIVTVLYPASLVITNGAFVVMILARRRRVKPS